MKITTYMKLGVSALALVVLGGCETLPGATLAGAPVSAASAEDAAVEFDLETITCWEVLSAPEDATAHAMTLLYGYAAGKSGKKTHSGAEIESVATRAGETCAANPDMPAYEAFK